MKDSKLVLEPIDWTQTADEAFALVCCQYNQPWLRHLRDLTGWRALSYVLPHRWPGGEAYKFVLQQRGGAIRTALAIFVSGTGHRSVEAIVLPHPLHERSGFRSNLWDLLRHKATALKAHRLEFEVSSTNVKLLALLERYGLRAGIVEEGVKRKVLWDEYKSTWSDLHLYAAILE